MQRDEMTTERIDASAASRSELQHLFEPRSIAIVGIPSARAVNIQRLVYLDGHIAAGFSGPLYVVNPKGGDYGGVPVYPSIGEIPGPVDYVICCLRAERVPDFARECASKGIKGMHVFSSGFGESGSQEGKRLETELLMIAKEAGFRIIGPNCMGIYCPKSRMVSNYGVVMESGTIGFLGQSGSNTSGCVSQGIYRGLRFSKAISYGNAIDVDECDLLEYLANDPDTEIIGAYIEGVKNGKRFFEVLRQTASKKATVILKGGWGQAGQRAAASHTGALAGSDMVWRTVFEQAGAILVDSMEEMLDMLVALQLVRPLEGRRVGVVGSGGGTAVRAADALERAGFCLPPYPKSVISELRKSEFFEEAGSSYSNPMDTAMMSWGRSNVMYVLDTVARLGGVDFLLVPLVLDPQPLALESVQYSCLRALDGMIQFAGTSSKPIVLVINPPYLRFGLEEKAFGARIPVFPTTERAGKALDRLVKYRNDSGRREGPDASRRALAASSRVTRTAMELS